MGKPKLAIVVLIAALIASNLYWFFRMIDHGYHITDMQTTFDNCVTATDQVFSLVPILASGEYSREDIVKAAKGDDPEMFVFEKEGYLWIGRIGIRFSAEGRVEDIRRNWE